jgi:hypothetical protein
LPPCWAGRAWATRVDFVAVEAGPIARRRLFAIELARWAVLERRAIWKCSPPIVEAARQPTILEAWGWTALGAGVSLEVTRGPRAAGSGGGFPGLAAQGGIARVFRGFEMPADGRRDGPGDD